MTIFFGFEQTVSNTTETKVDGRVVGRVITVSTTEQPAGILKREQKDTYVSAPLGSGFSGSGLKLSKSDTKTCVWSSHSYTPEGTAFPQPRQLSEHTDSWAWVVPTIGATSGGGVIQGAPIWTKVAETDTAWGYEHDSASGSQFVSGQTTQTKKLGLDSSGKLTLLPDQMVVKATQQAGTDWVVVATDTYNWKAPTDGATSSGNVGFWDVTGNTDISTGGGKRAGGTKSGGGR